MSTGEHGTHRKILVVDDERILADTLCEILTRNGFDCRAAYDAEHALALARQFPPDVVLTDVVMPGMNGVELAEELQAAYPATQILLLSGQSATSQLLGRAGGAARQLTLLPKPLAPELLLQHLRDLGS